MASLPSTMKAPGDHRHGIWRGGVLQVKVTNACDLDCKNCSVGVGIARKLKKIFRMTPEQFRISLRSLKGYDGVIGMFGGNPCIHPDFVRLCEIFREEVPNKAQRGLWSNRLFGHGAVCRATFNPEHSNLNVHGHQDAWDEMKRDWPESKPIPSGIGPSGSGDPSRHGPLFGSMVELGLPDAQMWEKIGSCYVNQTWSSEITVVDGTLVGYFCEVAATMAELTGDASLGLGIAPGWWQLPMANFEGQVNAYCTKCVVPLNGRKISAAGTEAEEYSPVWAPVFATIKGRAMKQVNTLAEITEGGGEPATKYLPKGVMRAGD